MIKSIVQVLLLGVAVAEDRFMYVFAQEWPGTVCRYERCQASAMGAFDGRRWNVHGFWPNTVNQTFCGQLANCRSEAFDPAQLSPDTAATLDLVWNGLYSDTNTFRGYNCCEVGTNGRSTAPATLARSRRTTTSSWWGTTPSGTTTSRFWGSRVSTRTKRES